MKNKKKELPYYATIPKLRSDDEIRKSVAKYLYMPENIAKKQVEVIDIYLSKKDSYGVYLAKAIKRRFIRWTKPLEIKKGGKIPVSIVLYILDSVIEELSEYKKQTKISKASIK